jgi:hypothetical protein
MTRCAGSALQVMTTAPMCQSVACRTTTSGRITSKTYITIAVTDKEVKIWVDPNLQGWPSQSCRVNKVYRGPYRPAGGSFHEVKIKLPCAMKTYGGMGLYFIMFYFYFWSSIYMWQRPGLLNRYCDGLRAGRLWFDPRAEARDFSLHHTVQTGSKAHPASYPMSTGGKAAVACSWLHSST